MQQGKNVAEEAIFSILSLAADQDEHSISFFVQELVGKFAKNTVYKYLKKAVRDGLMMTKQGTPEELYKPKFQITSQGVESVTKETLKNETDKWIDRMSREQAKLLLKRFMEENERLNTKLTSEEQQARDRSDFMYRLLRTNKKIIELSEGEGFEEFSVTKNMEELKIEDGRRNAALAEYYKKHPLKQNPSLNELERHSRDFNEYYEKAVKGKQQDKMN